MSKNDKTRSLVIITGMSGSGKHSAFKALEDLGYFCVDNLPTSLVPSLLQLASASEGKFDKLAVVVDVRLRQSVAVFRSFFFELKQQDIDSTIIFFDASDEVLARRFSETRRVHPLARESSALEGVRREREDLTEIRALADLVVDTTNFTVHDLRTFVQETFSQVSRDGRLNLSLISFGFKRGIPYHSDTVFDVRCLPNPYFVEGLRELTGTDLAVRDYLLNLPETVEFIDKLAGLLEYLIPKYVAEGKAYFVVSIGCTGGRHRSVVIVNELAARLKGRGHPINVVHRDIHLQ